VLVESARVEGKPRQRHVAWLASITESRIEVVHQRRHFWDGVYERLANQLSVEDRRKIEAAIALKVPRLSKVVGTTPIVVQPTGGGSGVRLWRGATHRQRTEPCREDVWLSLLRISSQYILTARHREAFALASRRTVARMFRA
jgi:hypothetical protein